MQETALPSSQVGSLEIFLVETTCPGYVRHDPALSKRWLELLKKEKGNTLADLYPRIDNPKAFMFVDKDMLEKSIVAFADPEGNVATPDEELAAAILTSCQQTFPKARLHPMSKKFSPEVLEKMKKGAYNKGPDLS